MPIKRLITWILAFIPITITMIVLPALPDKIPAHYGFDGNVTRFGSNDNRIGTCYRYLYMLFNVDSSHLKNLQFFHIHQIADTIVILYFPVAPLIFFYYNFVIFFKIFAIVNPGKRVFRCNRNHGV